MDRGYDPFFVDHYEEYRTGHFKKKPRLHTSDCDHDENWVCFDPTKNCKDCNHNADLLSKIIP